MRGGGRMTSSSSERVLVTGSAGLIGTALGRALGDRGVEVAGLDPRSVSPAARGDVRDPVALERAIAGCTGVVHLAAISRVAWAERDPDACWRTNVDGTRAVVAAAAARGAWVLFASSREVYGAVAAWPATEDTPLAPVNIYGRAKVAGERLVTEAAARGLPAGIVRLSNVYGRTADHPDRVVPAFVRAAIAGTPLHVEGAGHAFDFVYIDDVVRGLLALVARLRAGERTPTLQLVTGVSTTLGELARLAVELAGSDAPIVAAPERAYDVDRFSGSAERAHRCLGWASQVPLRDGLARLIGDFRAAAAPAGAG